MATATSIDESKRLAQRELMVTAIILTLFFAIGLGVVGVAGADRPGAAGLWAFGTLACGFIVGFLFGFPRVVTSEATATEQRQGDGAAGAAGAGAAQQFSYRLAINTNLEQVSDWLTKIIVGLGLVELRQIPAHIQQAGIYFGRGLAGEPGRMGFHEQLAAKILIYFAALGFLGGYLLTRMYFGPAFRRADEGTTGLTQAVQRQIQNAPLEQDGRKVELPPATKEASNRLAAVPASALGRTPEIWEAWARAQFEANDYQQALQGYGEAIRLDPQNPRLHYHYAIALKYAGRPRTEVMDALGQARRLARQDQDLRWREKIYASYTFNALYLPKPQGYELARAAGEEYRSHTENLSSGEVLLNLACAYGQQFAWEKERGDAIAQTSIRARALEALKAALAVTPALRPRAQQLLDGRGGEDDDLTPFSTDTEFRQAVGLP